MNCIRTSGTVTMKAVFNVDGWVEAARWCGAQQRLLTAEGSWF